MPTPSPHKAGRTARTIRWALALTAVVCIIAGSLSAQAANDRFARAAEPSTDSTVPAHTCTPTFCVIHQPPKHLVGGWPNPVLPALLLLIGGGSGLAALRLARVTGDAPMPKPSFAPLAARAISEMEDARCHAQPPA